MNPLYLLAILLTGGLYYQQRNKVKEQLSFEFDIVVNAQRIHENKFIEWFKRKHGLHPTSSDFQEFYKNEHYVYLEKRRKELFKKMNNA